ncbi:unnamed protein product, partial [Phaeothamnion confervicola]
MSAHESNADSSGIVRSTLDDFVFLKKLGSGSFGTVFEVKRVADSRRYVIKSVDIGELCAQQQLSAIQEVRLLAATDHPCVCRYYDSFVDRGSLHIVMDLCDGGDLAQLLLRCRRRRDDAIVAAAESHADTGGGSRGYNRGGSGGLPEEAVWSILLQVASGLEYLHAHRVLHRDLKAANIFLHGGGDGSGSHDVCGGGGNHVGGYRRHVSVRIGDLGVAKSLGTNTAFANTFIGTPYYLSPELCADRPYDAKSDMWALGVVLYEMLTLRRPFTASNQCALILRILSGRYEPLPLACPETGGCDDGDGGDGGSGGSSNGGNDDGGGGGGSGTGGRCDGGGIGPELRALSQRLLSADPADRPSAAEVLLEPGARERISATFPGLTGKIGLPSTSCHSRNRGSSDGVSTNPATSSGELALEPWRAEEEASASEQADRGGIISPAAAVSKATTPPRRTRGVVKATVVAEGPMPYAPWPAADSEPPKAPDWPGAADNHPAIQPTPTIEAPAGWAAAPSREPVYTTYRASVPAACGPGQPRLSSCVAGRRLHAERAAA